MHALACASMSSEISKHRDGPDRLDCQHNGWSPFITAPSPVPSYHARNTLPTRVFTERIECVMWPAWIDDNVSTSSFWRHLATTWCPSTLRFVVRCWCSTYVVACSFKFCYFIITRITIRDWTLRVENSSMLCYCDMFAYVLERFYVNFYSPAC